MIVPALLSFALFFLLLAAYIRLWLRRLLLPDNRTARIAANVLAVLLAAVSFFAFSTPGMVLLHFWVVSALWELPLIFFRRASGRYPKWPLRVIVPAVVTAVLAVWGIYNIAHPVQTRYVYETGKSIRPEGYRLVLITDTHYDTIQAPEKLAAAIPEINALEPDFVVLCGDIVEEGTSRERMEEAFSLLGGLDSTFGTYYVYGNHDRQAYSSSPQYSVEQLNAAIEDSSITILKSSYAVLNDEIILAGMEDPSWHREEPRIPASAVLDGADTGKLVLIADHQPNDWRANSVAGMDLQLSGHTHAGQIWPAGQFLELMGGLSYGRYDRDGCTAIVSSGFAGWGFTIRTSQRSEYVVVDIVPEMKEK